MHFLVWSSERAVKSFPISFSGWRGSFVWRKSRLLGLVWKLAQVISFEIGQAVILCHLHPRWCDPPVSEHQLFFLFFFTFLISSKFWVKCPALLTSAQPLAGGTWNITYFLWSLRPNLAALHNPAESPCAIWEYPLQLNPASNLWNIPLCVVYLFWCVTWNALKMYMFSSYQWYCSRCGYYLPRGRDWAACTPKHQENVTVWGLLVIWLQFLRRECNGNIACPEIWKKTLY